MLIKCLFFLVCSALLMAGCDRGLGKALAISSSTSRSVFSKDEIHLTNSSDITATSVTGKLKLHYSDREEEVSVAWGRWEPGEVKSVPIPNGLKNLQRYSLVGRIGSAFRNGSPDFSYQALDSSWIRD